MISVTTTMKMTKTIMRKPGVLNLVLVMMVVLLQGVTGFAPISTIASSSTRDGVVALNGWFDAINKAFSNEQVRGSDPIRYDTIRYDTTITCPGYCDTHT